MGPKSPTPQTQQLFGYPLDQHLNLKHPLIRKLPHQVDNSKLEIPVLNVLGMNSMGVLSPRESWGLNSL